MRLQEEEARLAYSRGDLGGGDVVKILVAAEKILVGTVDKVVVFVEIRAKLTAEDDVYLALGGFLQLVIAFHIVIDLFLPGKSGEVAHALVFEGEA